MYPVRESIRQILSELPKGIKLLAVSKFHPNEYIEAAYQEGQRIFGESREQELAKKVVGLPKDIQWHFIGHLQTNKVKYIVPYISMIEAVDSLKLLKEINKQAAKCQRVIDLDECRALLDDGEWRAMNNVRICGLMMMASFVEDENQIRSEMMQALDFFDEVKEKYFHDEPSFCERSWGMSHDYKIAIECHSTMVRIGTNIFGPRVY
jgi:hypothetical protein